jgi:2-(1,2-epoxy-1,2-dihydrophenyl)acetyl-CoA isomerase
MASAFVRKLLLTKHSVNVNLHPDHARAALETTAPTGVAGGNMAQVKGPDTEPALRVERDGATLVLTLNRPARFNAFTVELHALLAAALDEAASDDAVRAIILTGAGRGFCAGQDLSDRAVAPGDSRPDLGESLEKRYNPLIRRIRALDKPMIAAVNGVAAGAGANIALACDIVLAARSASFLQAFARIGLIPDSGGTWTLPRLIGEARARAAILLAEPISAEQAEAWGMIWKAVADDHLMAEARALASRLAAGPTYGYGLAKRALAASPNQSLEAQLNLERDLQRLAGASDDYLEGVRAFSEKRPPRFTGKGPDDDA